MTILLTNLDVGSGIEYVGNRILSWLKERKGANIIEYKYQTCISCFTRDLILYHPDVVIVNEYFPRIIEPLYYYKVYNPAVKILFISHSWKTLIDEFYLKEGQQSKRLLNIFCKDSCDKIICLNKKTMTDKKYFFGIESKLIELYMPVPSEEYKIITPWNDRKKLFGHFSRLDPDRLSEEFLDKIKSTDLQIDCYGDENRDRIKDIVNLIPYPRVKQEDMSSWLNKYKFFVLPHKGNEVFFITLLHSIMCGTIPLVVINKNDKNIDPTWIDWAKGLYFGTDNIDDLINNLKLFSKDTTDLTDISNTISQAAMKRFDENVIKNEIMEFVSKCGII